MDNRKTGSGSRLPLRAGRSEGGNGTSSSANRPRPGARGAPTATRHAFHTALAAMLASLAGAGTAHAHLPSERGVRILVGSEAVGLAIVVDGDCLTDFDDDGDGRLSKAEYDAHRAEIPAWIDARVQMLDAGGTVMSPSFSDAPIPDHAHLSAGDPVTHIRITRAYLTTPERPAASLAVRLFTIEDGVIPYFIQGPERTASGHFGPGPALIHLSAR